MTVKLYFASGHTQEFLGVVAFDITRAGYRIETRGVLRPTLRIHTSHSNGTDPCELVVVK
jgi:hypothetical protein